jgi:glucose/arabinose dehydrogenase
MIVAMALWIALWWLALAVTAVAPDTIAIDPARRDTITGRERLEWDQAAADERELGTLQFIVYVDNQGFHLTGISCRAAATGGFTCSAPLPPLTAGAHALELAAYVDSATRLESSRSAPLDVIVAPAAPAVPRSSPASLSESSIVTTDGLRLRLSPIVSGVVDPVDFAFTPDGRILVAERGGQLRFVRDGRLLSAAWMLPARHSDQEQLVAVAVDPDFERSRFVYAISTSTSARGDLVFSLARLRAVGDTLGDRIVLLDDILASPRRPSASVRFGPDGKLFAAFDDGGASRLAEDLASFNGKILRLNTDGTTPNDQAGNSPLYSSNYPSPTGLGWSLLTGAMWATSQQGESGRLSVIASEGVRRRGVVRATFALPWGTVPSAMAVYPDSGIPALRGNVLIASERGRHLLRLRVDPERPGQIVGAERLLQDQIGGVQSVTVGPDAAIYVGTARAIFRLSPAS